MALNIFGESLADCSRTPLTGFYRDGCCHTGEDDHSRHTVCAIMTEAFLQFSLEQGNDLITARPQFQFPGLQAGNRWCLCAARWAQAEAAQLAPPLILEACHEMTLQYIPMQTLIRYAYKNPN